MMNIYIFFIDFKLIYDGLVSYSEVWVGMHLGMNGFADLKKKLLFAKERRTFNTSISVKWFHEIVNL